MDDDLDVGSGSHILASVSRVRVERQKMQLPVPKPRGPRPLWGFTYTKFPKPGEAKFVITDEVRFTALCLIVVGAVCVLGFMAADLGLNRIKVRDVLETGGHGLAVLIGGIFSALACILSGIQIRSHHKNWTHPPSQREVVRILWMVPIYAVSALLSLTFLNMSAYIDFVRGVYEAFVIYTFMILLTKYLGGHNGVVEWMKYKPPQPWPSPLCCLKPVVPDSTYLYYLKYGALQYTILTPICSLAAVVLSSFDMFEEGVLEVDNGYPYIAFVMNASQLISLYCLVWLYVCVKNELAPFGPLAKFLVVKAVVFLTFWQGIALAFAVHFGWITKSDNFSVGEVQVGLQDFLLCIEMFLAACTHKYTFGSETYADGTLRLIMEQRALYLAEISYKRGVEAQKEALAALEAQGLLPASPHPHVAEETAAERAARQEAMVEAIRREMDEDSGSDVLFDEDLVDWTSGALPSPTNAAAAAAGLPGATALAEMPKRTVARASAYDYVYAYELEQQRPEGVDLPEVSASSAAEEDDETEGGLSMTGYNGRNGIGGRVLARSDYADEALPIGDEEVDFGYDHPPSPSMVKPPARPQQQQQQQRGAPRNPQGQYRYAQAQVQYGQAQDEEEIFDEPAPVQPVRQQQARAQPPRQQQPNQQQQRQQQQRPQQQQQRPQQQQQQQQQQQRQPQQQQRPQQQQQQPQAAHGGPRGPAPGRQQQPQQQNVRRPPPPAAHVVDMDENPFD